MSRRLRLLLRSEAGLAVPVVMGTMVVLSLLASALLSTAMRSASGAQGDTNSKRALAAAEAGLQTAALRIRKLNPSGTMCMVTPSVANPTGAVAPAATPVAPNGTCPASTPESIGAGATFTYWVTPRGATCALSPGTAIAANDRCITSLGIVNGIRRRIQVRVDSGPNFPFAKAGIAGSDRVTLTNKVTIKKTDVGSNGPITLTGSPGTVDITSGAQGGVFVPGEARPYVPTGGTVIRTGTTTIAGGIVNSTSAYGLVQPDFSVSLPPTVNANDNGALAASLAAQGIAASAWNATTRVLSIPASKTFILPAGRYNFCSFSMASGSKVDMPNNTAKAEIYLDSPLRGPASGCAAGTGTAVMTDAKMNNGVSDRNIWFWVYGTKAPPYDASNPLANDIQMVSGSHIDAVWYAPYSRFYANGTGGKITVHGAVAAREVLMTNDVEAGFDVAVAQDVGPGAGPVTRRGWFECKAVAPIATDPESGC